MFLQNQIDDLPNHYEIIKQQFEKANEIRLVVAYIKKKGVDVLRQFLNKQKNIKLLCSFDMNITDPNAIQELLNMGVEVKFYRSNEGTFHPKIWLFQENKKWNCIIGSANLSKAALFDNVEASVFIDSANNINGVVEQSLFFFNYLWNSEYSKPITNELLGNLQNKIASRKNINERINRTEAPKLFLQTSKIEVLFEFVKSWIGIDKDEKEEDLIGSLWRGWYIIPDQGYIDNNMMQMLRQIAKLMLDNGGYVVLSDNDDVFKEILTISENPNRRKFKMQQRDLFVRQQKNYLMKFGFAYHKLRLNKKTLDKNTLYLTSLGEELAECNTIDDIKRVYTDFLEDYKYNGLQILPFVQKLLAQFTTISFEEFSYFVIHAYTENELNEIGKLISIYRTLDADSHKLLQQKIDDHFSAIKEPTAKSVRSNYDKKVKHTISALGWCVGIKLNPHTFELAAI